MPSAMRRKDKQRRDFAAAYAKAFRRNVVGHFGHGGQIVDDWVASTEVAARYVRHDALRGLDKRAREVSSANLVDKIFEGTSLQRTPIQRVIALCVIAHAYRLPVTATFAAITTPGKKSPFLVWATPYLVGFTDYQIREGVRLFKRGQKMTESQRTLGHPLP